MDKKDEALKLALECIEAWDRGGNASDYWRDRFDAITAIREALAEQPAKEKAPQSANCEAPGWINSDHTRRDDCTTEQPAQQEQESWEDLHNALQRIDTAAVGLPTFEVRHEGGLDAVTQNIVDAITALHVQPAQHEPVAWIGLDDADLVVCEKGGKPQARYWERVLREKNSKPVLRPCRSPYCECSVGQCSHPGCYDARGEPLPPAQRTWVGLTDEELEEILADHIDDPYAVAFTVNHKLKEKNT